MTVETSIDKPGGAANRLSQDSRWQAYDGGGTLIILAGTGPAGGGGIVNVGAVLQDAFGKAGATNKHPKHFPFFTQTRNGQTAADNFLQRLKERTKDVDAPVSNETVQGALVVPSQVAATSSRC